MKYVVSSDSYFKMLSLQESASDQLIRYFNSIPNTFFEAINNTDFNKDINIKSVHTNHTTEEILEHQFFLLEKVDDIADIIKKEDFLVRTGYDTIALRLDGTYLEKVQAIDEGVLSSVWGFIKLMVEDPDPTEMTLNIIRLVLDVIGIVPFTWVGMPIDVVANVLSGLISLYKGDYFSAILSIIATLDITKVSTSINLSLKPIAHILNPIMKILCRSSKEAIDVGKLVIKLSDDIIKISGRATIKTVADFFKLVGKFFTGAVINIVRAIVAFTTKVFDLVTFGGLKKVTASILRSVDNMIDFLAGTGKNFDTASKLLMDPAIAQKLGRTEAGVLAKAEAGKIGKSIPDQILAKKQAVKQFDRKIFDLASSQKTSYVGDLLTTVKNNTKFMDSIKGLKTIDQEAMIAAKVENELLGQVAKSSEKAMTEIMKDPALAKHFAEKYGLTPTKDYLIKITTAGDDVAVKQFFEIFVSDPKLSKLLSPAELRAFTPFAVKPEAFTAGLKNFDNASAMLKTIAKGGTRLAQRRIPMLRLINFISRLFLNKYGSFDCIKEVLMNKATGFTPSMQTTPVTEEVQSTDIIADINKSKQSVKDQTAANYNETPVATAEPELTDQTVSTKSPEQIKKETLKAKETDCFGLGLATKAAVGNFMTNMGSTAMLGGSPDVANDPKKAKNFLDTSTELQKSYLKASGLNDNIGVQHELDMNPLAQAYFADVWDANSGTIQLNTSDSSNVDDSIKYMIDKGIIKPEEAATIKAEVMRMIETGESPDIKLPSLTNESLLVKTFSFLRNK